MKYLHLFMVAIIFMSCEKGPEQMVIQFENPGSIVGSEPNLHITDDGTIYLSWIKAIKGKNSQLLISTLNHSNLTWTKTITIAEGADWFVNWADFPSIASFGKGNIAAHYLDKSADDTYAYDVKLKLSNDQGKTWNKVIIPHKDKTHTEHGFVSKVGIDNGNLLSVWLDGRKYAYSEKDSTIAKEMTLRGAILNEQGSFVNEFELDGRVCDCCQTDTAMTQNGPIVVYRDRSDKEVRDISYVRLVNNEWTEPKPIYNDNWSIFGCPVNGPAISTLKNNVAVSWFSNANDTPEIKITFSDDNGETFKKPIKVTQNNPSGRVDVAFVDDNSALVSWLDNIDNKAVIQLQRILKTGGKSSVITVSESSESRSSGFPRMVIKDNDAFLTWTNSGDTLTIKTAKIKISTMSIL